MRKELEKSETYIQGRRQGCQLYCKAKNEKKMEKITREKNFKNMRLTFKEEDRAANCIMYSASFCMTLCIASWDDCKEDC